MRFGWLNSSKEVKIFKHISLNKLIFENLKIKRRNLIEMKKSWDISNKLNIKPDSSESGCFWHRESLGR